MERSQLYLADKKLLEPSEIVYCFDRNTGIYVEHKIIFIENGGCIGESIVSETHYLSNAVIFTTDKNKELL